MWRRVSRAIGDKTIPAGVAWAAEGRGGSISGESLAWATSVPRFARSAAMSWVLHSVTPMPYDWTTGRDFGKANHSIRLEPDPHQPTARGMPQRALA